MNLWKQFARFYRYAKTSIKKYAGYFWLANIGFWLGIFIADTIIPLQYKKIINHLTSNAPNGDVAGSLWWMLVVLVALYLSYNLLFRMSDFGMYKSQEPIARDLHNRSFAELTAHSYKFFTDNFSGSLVAKSKRFIGAFEKVHDEVLYHLGTAFISIVTTLTVFSLQNIWLGVFFLIWLIFYFIITITFLVYKNPHDLERAAADSKTTGTLADVITNILTIKIFSSRKQEIDHYKEVTKNELRARLKVQKIWTIQIGVQSFLFTMLEVIGIIISVVLWSKGSISIGTIVLVQLFFASIFNHMWNLGRSITKFTEALSDASEMLDILEKPIEVKDAENPEKSRIKNGEIKIDKINFHYHKNNQVFTDFSLTIPAGQRVGLVGASGCGKSTLTKLLLRFVDIQSGAILIDGQDIKAITQDDLRRAIAYVPQDPVLFHRTLRENIAYGKPGATEDEIIAAAKKAHAHEFISQLPTGYDTLVGERGIKLSGGERQRVAIARAMLKNAPIIILDEATSSLDTESERYIQDALNELIKGRTTIVIAHRLSTIQKMDRIVVMEKGQIVEDGNHDELLKNKEVYHKFWQYQIEGME